jgi:tRNA(Ile)-lysidine synthase
VPLTPVEDIEFAALMAPLGPFEPAVHLAVAVSGGADSLALALLARDWARARGGRVIALESADEAVVTLERLDALGITAQGLALHGLAHGPALAERARTARHGILATAARHLGVLHLLFGHHAGDQAETVAMRRLSGSGAAGLAGMAALVETDAVRLLRPLLSVPPGRLRATLRQTGMAWVEDPSNANPAALRARLRRHRGDAAGEGVLTRAAGQAAAARGAARAAVERTMAAELAARVRLHPWGYAVLSPGPLSALALAALLRGLAGAAHAPAPGHVETLAATPRPATLGGVRVQPAGRLGPGWLLTREVAAMAPSVPACPGAIWDGRFRLAAASEPPVGARIGALGPAAAGLRAWPAARMLPAAVLATLPAVWHDAGLFAVPHLGYPDDLSYRRVRLDFAPPMPIAGAPFVPATGEGTPSGCRMGRACRVGDVKCHPPPYVLATGPVRIIRTPGQGPAMRRGHERTEWPLGQGNE